MSKELLNTKLENALATGMLWIRGEMEFPINQGPHVAFNRAQRIANNSGYVVTWKSRYSAIEIAGGEISGSYVVDWGILPIPIISSISHYHVDTAYSPVPQEPRYADSSSVVKTGGVYLGHFQKYDLYWHPQGTIPTVIARYGNQPWEYLSGMPFADGNIPSLTEAKQRAIARNLSIERAKV